MNVKPVKIFECSCANDFTGDFCEFKTEQNELLYLGPGDFALPGGSFSNGFVANDEGQLISESITFDDDVQTSGFCFTMLNGEAVIFGGDIFRRQVKSQTVNFSKHAFIF